MSETNWHILIFTYGGTVSLLKNLTEDVAIQTMRRLDASIMREAGFVSDGDVRRFEAFGPEGKELKWYEAVHV